MTQEERSLLLRDLCARLPYGVKVQDEFGIIYEVRFDDIYLADILRHFAYISTPLKPYLRPLSSMDCAEQLYAENKWGADNYGDIAAYASGEARVAEVGFHDWLNEHHFDYRNLIKKGLALEAPDGMYNHMEC